MRTSCVDCGASSPEIDSPREWRCPSCAASFAEAMAVARSSSARFRVATERQLPDEASLQESGERLAMSWTPDDDTRPDSRGGMIQTTLREIFIALAKVPTSRRVRQLRSQAEAFAMV